MQIRIATHDEHRMAVIQEAVKQFRKEHPDVSVILEMLPDKTWMREKLMEMLQSGNGPDIVEWEDANIAQCLEEACCPICPNSLYVIKSILTIIIRASVTQ